MGMAKRKKKDDKLTKAEEKSLKQELVSRMLTLATSGFGFVAALAWNSLIQDFVKEFVEPRIPGSGLTYKFLYAILISFLAVLITYQLSKLLAHIESSKK